MSETYTPEFPEAPQTVAPAHPNRQTLDLLARRRSTVAKLMGGPGPDPQQLDTLLQLAARTPDHGKLFPWRFMVFEGDARERFGEILEARLRELEPGGPEDRYTFERQRFLRAPLVIAVISSVTPDHKIPEWEQILSAGAVCFNILVSASAMGFAAQWLSEWYAYDETVAKAMKLGPHERVAGFMYIGTATEDPAERPRQPPRIERWSS